MDAILFIIKSIILGVVEGITEFLPISSTGHMVIVENIIHFNTSNPQYVEMYTYVIQLGAILAVVLLYWKKIWSTVVTLIPKKNAFKESGFYFWLMILVACIPGAVAQLSLDAIAEKYLFNPISVAITLFVGAIFMLVAEKYLRKQDGGINTLSVTAKQALIIGCFQCLAIIPGMSRSASTIIGGWAAGLGTVTAAEFSFFLAIPVMVGMSLLKIIKVGGLDAMSGLELISLVVGFIVSFGVAVVVIKQFINYLKTKPMKVFAYYRMVFAVIVILAGFAGLFKA